MNQANQTSPNSHGGLMDLLLRSGDALQNRQALLTLGATTVGSIVIMMACVASGAAVLIGLGSLLTVVLVYAGFSAAGIQLMDQAQGEVPRGLVPALMDGLMAAIKLFVLGLIAGGLVFLTVLAVALVLLICKIPGLGSLLLVFVVPLAVLALAFLFASLYFAMAMVGPAVWSGASLKEALAMLWGLATRRLVGMALGMLMHTLIMGFVSIMVLSFVAGASAVVGGMSAAFLNLGGGLLSMVPGFGGGYYPGSGSSGGSLLSLGFGFGILAALIGAGLLLMFMLGLNRLYLHLTSDLDISEVSSKLAGKLDKVRDKTKQALEETKRRNDEVRARRNQQNAERSTDGSATSAPASKQALSCPQCHQAVEPGDKFCEHCGYSLRGSEA